MIPILPPSSFFFFNDTATTEIYTLSLHDALPIFRHDRSLVADDRIVEPRFERVTPHRLEHPPGEDRKSTRLNSSHVRISYAVFCLKKKKKHEMYSRINHTNVSR